MSIWHCEAHGLTGPMACCPNASRAEIGERVDEKDDFATVMRVVQRIVTAPDRTQTMLSTRDLKAFARLVTAQLERVVALEQQLADAEAERSRLRADGARRFTAQEVEDIAFAAMAPRIEVDRWSSAFRAEREPYYRQWIRECMVVASPPGSEQG